MKNCLLGEHFMIFHKPTKKHLKMLATERKMVKHLPGITQTMNTIFGPGLINSSHFRCVFESDEKENEPVKNICCVRVFFHWLETETCVAFICSCKQLFVNCIPRLPD